MATKRLVLLTLLTPLLCGFVPYEHEGTLALTTPGGEARGRALFSSSAASSPDRVLVYGDFALPAGGEGFLTLEITLAPIGQEAPVRWTYYEKLSPGVVSFDATEADGFVIMADRHELGDETSLYLEFEVTLRDGGQERVLTDGYALTTPSPAVLRGSGQLPPGVVTTAGRQAGDSYHRGTIDCYGEPDDVVVIEDYYVEEVVEEEEIIIIVDDGGSSIDDYDGETDDEYVGDLDSDDYDYDYEDEYYYDDYGSGSDESLDCGGDSDSDSSSSGDSDSGPECEGDAVAAPSGTLRYQPAALRVPGGAERAAARKILQISPMLLLLAVLLLLRRRSSGRADT